MIDVQAGVRAPEADAWFGWLRHPALCASCGMRLMPGAMVAFTGAVGSSGDVVDRSRRGETSATCRACTLGEPVPD